MYNNNKGLVISGFPGVGKSTAAVEWRNKGYKVIDLDSSTFSKGSTTLGNQAFDWVTEYVNSIYQHQLEYDFIFVSSHDNVRTQMGNKGIDFYLVFPRKDQKNYYITRYKSRGSSEPFINMLNTKFNMFVDGCLNDKYGKQVILRNGLYLSDILGFFNKED